MGHSGVRRVFIVSLPTSWLVFFSSRKPQELPAWLHRALDGAPESLRGCGRHRGEETLGWGAVRFMECWSCFFICSEQTQRLRLLVLSPFLGWHVTPLRCRECLT